MTLSMLSDSKTATGTVTFNLADYDLVLNTNGTGTVLYPGQTGTTTPVLLYNTYKVADGQNSFTGTAEGGGTTAGMGPVYIKMVITSITVGETVENWDASSIAFSNNNGVVMTNASSGLTVTLESFAGTGMNWFYDANSGAIYLSSTTNKLTKTTLAFSQDATLTPASIIFDLIV